MSDKPANDLKEVLKWSDKEIMKDLRSQKKDRMEKVLTGLSGSATMNNANFVQFGSYTGTSITSTSSWNALGEKKIVSVTVKEITIEIVYRQQSFITYTSGTISINNSYQYQNYNPDRVWKEIYGLKDGKMTLLEVVTGKIIPEQHIPESIEFDDEE